MSDKRVIRNSLNDEILSGEITALDKRAIVNIGQYFIDLGRALQEVKTYEEHADIIDESETKMEDFEKLEDYDKAPIMNSTWE